MPLIPSQIFANYIIIKNFNPSVKDEFVIAGTQHEPSRLDREIFAFIPFIDDFRAVFPNEIFFIVRNIKLKQ